MVQMICGVYGGRNGLKRPSDGPFSLTPAEEARLVARGVARYVLTEKEAAAAAEPRHAISATDPVPVEDPDEPEPAAEEDLMDLTKAQLLEMAQKLGLDARKCRNKSEIVALIESFGGDDGGDDVVV